MPHALLRIAILCAVAVGLAAAPAADSSSGSIYDSGVERRLDLTPEQRSKVLQIIAESERQVTIVFNKYGIDPNARPVFDKLVEASTELQAIERRERQEMKKVLSREQLRQYDRIIDETRIRVRKAAQ